MREHLAWSGAKLLVLEDDATLARAVLTQLAEGNESLKADYPDDDEPGAAWRRFT